MKFKGYGIVWNGIKNKTLVNFKLTPEYETNDPEEIEILCRCNAVTEKSGSIDIKENTVVDDSKEDKPMTKNDVMASLDASGIKYSPRDKKEVLSALLEG